MTITDKRSLPNWFNLDNYSSFTCLSDEELFYQLVVRYEMLENYYQYVNVFDIELMDDEVQKILGNGIVADARDRATYFYDAFKLPIKRDGVLPGAIAITPMSIEDYISISGGVDKYMEDNFKGTPESLLYHSFTSVNYFLETNEIFIKVDLSRPNDLLVDAFKTNLENWRNALNIKEKDKVYQSWDTIKKRIFDYSLFPFIDLIIWSKVRGVTITNAVLAVAVYPNGGYDSINIQQTIKPNIEKIFSISSIEKIRSEFKSRKILRED